MSNSAQQPLGPLLSHFLSDHLIHERGCSDRTRQTYAQTFILLLAYLKKTARKDIDRVTLEDVTPELVSKFLLNLEMERGNSRSTRNARLAALRSFFRYVQARVPAALEQSSRIRAMKAKKKDMPNVEWMTVEEVVAVLRSPDVESLNGLADRALLVLTYVCGLRVSEALSLTLDDLMFGVPSVLHVMGKGRRRRTMPLAASTVGHLRAWLRVRPKASTDLLFVNRHGRPLSRAAFALRLTKYVLKASVSMATLSKKKITPHVLRHSCAMHMLKETKDIRKVSLWLGHATLATTEIYLHADPVEKLEILTASGDLGIKAGRFSPNASALMAMLRSAQKGDSGLAKIEAKAKPRNRPEI